MKQSASLEGEKFQAQEPIIIAAAAYDLVGILTAVLEIALSTDIIRTSRRRTTKSIVVLMVVRMEA